MIDKKYIELMNKEIDGEINTIEQQRLHSYLSANPEAQKFHNELCRTSDLLSKIPGVAPSPNIKKYVMNSIDLNRYAKATKPGRLTSRVSNLLVKPSPKLAYAFALGILVGILVYSALLENVISKRGTDVTEFYGTIGVDEKAGFKTIHSIPIALPDINGSIAIKRYQNIVVIETDVRTLKETEILFEYDESHLKFSHFSSGGRSKISFDFRGNDVRASALGNVQYCLFFNEVVTDGKPSVLKLFVVGELRFIQNIAL